MRIDIYFSQKNANRFLAFVCKLIEKAVASEHIVLVLCTDESSAQDLDSRLWHTPANNFIPHRCLEPTPSAGTATTPASPTTAAPVLIATPNLTCPNDFNFSKGYMLNLGIALPDYWQKFARVAECIQGDTSQPLTAIDDSAVAQRLEIYRNASDEFHEHVIKL